MDKTVILIARAFSPVKAIATERISKIARSFVEKGYKVKVITIDTDNIKTNFFDDKRDGFITKSNIEIVRVKYKYKEFYYIYETIDKNLKYYFLKIIARLLFFVGFDSSIGWNANVKQELEKIVKSEKVDLIVASGSPFMMFHVPYYINKKYHIPYLLDFRDLWYAQPHGKRNIFQRCLARILERKYMDSASLITTVSEGCKKKLLENTINKNIKVLYNLPDKYYINELLALKDKSNSFDLGIDSKYFNIVYTGTLYEGRDLTSIAKALLQLDKKSLSKIKVHYFGNQGKIAIENFKEFGLEKILINHGSVSKQESIMALFQCDMMLSIIHNNIQSGSESIQGIITTKIFDYIIINKPTINIAPIDNETRVLIDKLEVKNIFSFTSKELIEIKNIIELVLNNNLVYPNNNINMDLWKKSFDDIVKEF